VKTITATNGDKKHNTGVYCHSIPYNPLTGLSTIDYKEAEDRGYFKIDFLNASVYNSIKSEKHIKDLLAVEPLWDLLEQKDFCDLIFHVNGYHNLVAELKPRSIEELAMFLALLRPGKKHLVSIVSEKGFQAVKDEIWVKTEDAYYFKKSHAVAYAHAIVVQMNQICEAISYPYA
jgi:DNA polymerase III alpha subunit